MPVCEFCIEGYRKKNTPYTRLPEGYSNGDVIELTDDNFDEVVMGSNQAWNIAFVAPWCYHCKLMLPAFTTASQKLGGEVRFATINADKNRVAARKFNIMALPTIKYFDGGYGKTYDGAKNYESGRSEYEFTSFAQNLLSAYNANPNKPAWVDPSTTKPQDLQTCDTDMQMEGQHVDESCQSALPAEVKSVCTDGSLCVVAFLHHDTYEREKQITELGIVAG